VRRLRTALVVAALLVPAGARADDVADCIDANEKAVQQRKDHRLRDARITNSRCTATSCPEDLRRICADRSDKLNDAIPSIVFDLRDGTGHDLTGVAVTVDGAATTADLGSTALELDPGLHTFVFTSAGQTAERSFVLREGEKQRREAIVIGPVPEPPPPPPPAPSAVVPVAPPVLPSAGPPVAAYTALGVGGLGAVAAAVFGSFALANKSSLDGACGADKKACPSSSQSDIRSMHENALVSDVGLGVAVVGLGLGGVLLLVRHQSPTAAAHVEPWLGARSLGMTGTF